MKNHIQDFFELIRLCSTNLPKDVEKRITEFMEMEDKGSTAKSVLEQILRNCEMARERSFPICQDTGTNLYWIDYPAGMCEKEIRQQIVKATKLATKEMAAATEFGQSGHGREYRKQCRRRPSVVPFPSVGQGFS